jgi:transposase
VGYNFLHYGCDQDFLLPPDARDWLPAGHLSWAVIDAVGELDLSEFLAYYRSDGQGRPAYHPKMMTALVLYCYCKGIRSSRAVQMACSDDVGCRVITGNQAIDHATVARFVRRHRDPLTGLFVQVLAVCAREGLVTVDLVAGDGTKVKANASKAASCTLEELDVSIAELQKALEAEVTAWWHQADLLDSQDEQAATDADRAVPAATGTRKRTADRLARAGQAREMLAQRHGDTRGAATALGQARQRAVKAAKRLADETAAHQQKLDRYQESQQAKASGGGGRAGRPPKPMDQAAKVCAAQSEQERADAALQRALADPNKGNVPKGNTTDPHCRIMPAKTGGYMCARNLQALANDRQIILAMLLHDNPIDVGALHPLLNAGRANLDAIGITRAIGQVLFDAGYASKANFTADCEAACW